MSTTKKKILAVDLGYSSVKCNVKNSYGGVDFERILNVVAKLPEAPDTKDDDSIFQHLDNYYCLGQNGLKIGRENQIEVNDWESLKLVYPIWLSYLAKRYGGEEGFNAFDKIIIGLSLAFGEEKATELLEYLYDELLFPPDKRDLFIVLPQGVAAKAAYQEFGMNLRDTDSAARNETKLKNYIILDIGQYSIDCASVISSNSSSMMKIGVENTGTIQISYKIIDYIFQNFNGLRISLKEAMGVAETGTFIRRRVNYDLSKQVTQYQKEYIRDVLNLLEDKMSSVLDVTEGILVIGGGSAIFEKLKNDPEVIKEIEKHFPMEFLKWPLMDADQFNSRSYLLIGEKLMNGEL